MNDAQADEARVRFALHYLKILAWPLGLPSRIMPDGTVQAHLDTGVLYVANTAPDDPERLDLALVTTVTTGCTGCTADQTDKTSGEIDEVTAGPIASAVDATRRRLPGGTTLEQHPDHPELLIARSDTVLAGPDQLPEHALLVQVLPRLLDRLHHTLDTYAPEATLTGISNATQATTGTEGDGR